MDGKRSFRAEQGYLELWLGAMLYFWLCLATILEISETHLNYNDLQKFTEKNSTVFQLSQDLQHMPNK